MNEQILIELKKYFYSYFIQKYGEKELNSYINTFEQLFPCEIQFTETEEELNFEKLNEKLAHINETEEIKKKKGVFYTPNDITDFITKYSIILSDINNNYEYLFNQELNKESFINKTFFDPTCGAGEFLFSVLLLKLNTYKDSNILDIVSTIYGNDINIISICITKIRLLLLLLNQQIDLKLLPRIVEILNTNFTCFDYILDSDKNKYDIIIGNPPYVEDNKSGISLPKKYGNLYANVLSNSLGQLNTNGVFAFIIPISYISTPRMNKIRDEIYNALDIQYILNYSDRPGCLFPKVHQKICIIIGKNAQLNQKLLYTSNYLYFTKNERKDLFIKNNIVLNNYKNDSFIPKFGNPKDISIYNKIENRTKELNSLIKEKETKYNVFLNMRAAFWIKAFLKEHNGNDYKKISFSKNNNYYFYCLINSSLFWWYWVCVSDCWHITNKEFNKFMIPEHFDENIVKTLAKNLEKKLEETKKFIGTVQVDYEYKHKKCINEIHAIDNYINNLYELTEEESSYIANYALEYRIGNKNNE